MWFEFLVGSRHATRFFSGFSGFPPSAKPNILKYCDLFTLKLLFFFDQVMVALYDYNPEVQSPQDNPDSELPFKKGQVLTVVGEMVSLLTVKCASL